MWKFFSRCPIIRNSAVWPVLVTGLCSWVHSLPTSALLDLTELHFPSCLRAASAMGALAGDWRQGQQSQGLPPPTPTPLCFRGICSSSPYLSATPIPTGWLPRAGPRPWDPEPCLPLSLQPREWWWVCTKPWGPLPHTPVHLLLHHL